MKDRKGPMWAVCCFYNPEGYRSRYENYQVFRRNLAIPLVTVELVYGTAAELREGHDAEILIQLPGRDVMWQKERLLNLGFKSVPNHCDYIACVDCTVVFHRSDWHERAAELLKRHVLIQPFSEMLTALPSLEMVEKTPTRYSVASLVDSGVPPEEALFEFSHRCVTGLAWIGRRDVLQRRGFYDGCIIGGGDRAIACAGWGEISAYEASTLNSHQAKHYRPWANGFYESVRGNIGCLSGTASYLWHGDHRLRSYRERYEILRRHDFDPSCDIRIDESGAWSWNSEKQGLHDEVKAYFGARREDDPPGRTPVANSSKPEGVDR